MTSATLRHAGWILRGNPPSEDHLEHEPVPFAQQRVGIPG